MDRICAAGACRTPVNSEHYPYCARCHEIRVREYLRAMKKYESAKKALCYHCREEIYLDGTKWLIGGGENWIHIRTFQPFCQCIAKPMEEVITNAG